jgi:hypothetical protein
MKKKLYKLIKEVLEGLLRQIFSSREIQLKNHDKGKNAEINLKKFF